MSPRPLFVDADTFDLCVRGESSPAVAFRSAWKVLGRTNATATEYHRAAELAAEASRKEPRRADYLTALGVAQVRTGAWRAAAQTLAAAGSMVRNPGSVVQSPGSPDAAAQCGEELPVIFGAYALLSVEESRTQGFIQLGEARQITSRSASTLTLDMELLLNCDLVPGISAQEWERNTQALAMKELEELAHRLSPKQAPQR